MYKPVCVVAAGGGAAVENRERIAELDSQVFDLKQRNEKLTRRVRSLAVLQYNILYHYNGLLIQL